MRVRLEDRFNSIPTEPPPAPRGAEPPEPGVALNKWVPGSRAAGRGGGLAGSSCEGRGPVQRPPASQSLASARLLFVWGKRVLCRGHQFHLAAISREQAPLGPGEGDLQ